jgi:hypothetical protein
VALVLKALGRMDALPEAFKAIIEVTLNTEDCCIDGVSNGGLGLGINHDSLLG